MTITRPGNEISIEEMNTKTFEQEIKTIADKYNTYIRANDNVRTMQTKFKYHYQETHNNIDLEHISIGNEPISTIIDRMTTYQELETILDNHFGNDMIENRINQLATKFKLGRPHFKNILTKKDEGYNLMPAVAGTPTTEEEIKNEIIKTSEKKIILNVWSMEEKYKARDNIRNLAELLNNMFKIEINAEIPDSIYYENYSLKGYEEYLNEQQNDINIKLFKNGNIYLTFENKDNQKLFRNLMILETLKWVTKWRK